MTGRNQIILGLIGVLLVAGAAYFLAGNMGLGDFAQNAGEEGAPIEGDLADMTPGERLCAAQTTVDSIRTRIFNRAREATENDAAALTRLETGTVARMESPRLVRFDDGLEEARCEGRLVFELPRGTEVAFSDNRRLMVNLVYYAQPSGNGSSQVSRMEGANGLIGRLAQADLTNRRLPDIAPEDIVDTGEEDGKLPPGDGTDNGGIDYDRTGLPPPIENESNQPENILPPVMDEGAPE